MMTAPGMIYHQQFLAALRKTREEMAAEGLIHGESVSSLAHPYYSR
jgi:hypothetical protein